MTAGPGAAVRFDHVSYSVRTGRDQLEVVRDCSFHLNPGEIAAMIGPSGGGKSTIGYLLAGYSRPTGGSVTVDGLEVKGPSAQRLLLFQENALMPWLTTAENIMFGPRARGTKRAQARRSADEILARIGLTDFADRYPGELSGGMRRRAELARALVNEPSVLILDEPFRGLDAMTRELMQEYTAELLTEQGRTALFITTDIDEALLLADRLLVVSDRPATVLDEFTITGKRPRNRADVLLGDRIQEIKDRTLDLLRPQDAVAGLKGY
ncbi:ABC transporter ATP-binding protein [Mycolicibacterium sp. Dal123E01]|uniref:ABC transporter ATP-binding protein n=1 Tax=Mycolicibacterium sp. Dal123E01 TaxID=3457578 RepID=UPI00403E9E18